MKYLLFLLSSCFLLSCGDRKVPSGIIPPEQMQTIVWQLMQTDEFTAATIATDTTKNLDTERIKRYRQVFQLNNTSKEDFEKSYNYYMAHPDISKTMFDSLSARANRRNDTAVVPLRPGQGLNKLNLKALPPKSK